MFTFIVSIHLTLILATKTHKLERRVNKKWLNIDNWLVVPHIFLFSIIYGIILPIDFHMFQDG